MDATRPVKMECMEVLLSTISAVLIKAILWKFAGKFFGRFVLVDAEFVLKEAPVAAAVLLPLGQLAIRSNTACYIFRLPMQNIVETFVVDH